MSNIQFLAQSAAEPKDTVALTTVMSIPLSAPACASESHDGIDLLLTLRLHAIAASLLLRSLAILQLATAASQVHAV